VFRGLTAALIFAPVSDAQEKVVSIIHCRRNTAPRFFSSDPILMLYPCAMLLTALPQLNLKVRVDSKSNAHRCLLAPSMFTVFGYCNACAVALVGIAEIAIGRHVMRELYHCSPVARKQTRRVLLLYCCL